MNGAISWVMLQHHIIEAIPRTRRMDFRNLEGISSLRWENVIWRRDTS